MSKSLYTIDKMNRDPSSNDTSYVVGEMWLNTTTGKLFQLISKENNVATWEEIGKDIPIRRV